jgi:hypothetical protein
VSHSPHLDPNLAPLTVMFVRHGEKPDDHGPPHGVNRHGEHDAHSLSVRGWTRAGALVGLFAHAPTVQHPDVVVPQRIVATKPSEEAKSKREYDTASPLADRLRIVVDDDHEHGHEHLLRDSILSDARDTLVVWHHGKLAQMVRGFPIRNLDDVPQDWPDDRFDLIWILSRTQEEADYLFSCADQQLLDGDAGVV